METIRYLTDLNTFRVRVTGSDDEAHLRLDRVDGRGVVDHDDQVAGALVVKSKVLGEGLSHHHLEAALFKIPAKYLHVSMEQVSVRSIFSYFSA